MNRTGRRWAIHTSACGRAVLATMSPAAREQELAPLLTPELREELKKDLDRFAACGYIVSDISQLGLRSIAAPIFDSSSLAIGAIGVADVVMSMDHRRVAEIGQSVRSAARDTSQALGYPGSWNGRSR